MPIPSNPQFLSNVLGYAADMNSIPATTPSGSGAFSYQSGFPAITSIPLTAGGIAPDRLDFNGLINLLSQHIFFQQSGCVYPWSETLDYLTGSHVLGSDGNEYIALLPSGPDVPGSSGGVVGPVNPVGDDSGVWSLGPSQSQALSFKTGTLLTSSGTWTAPDTRYYLVMLVGGGGGGSGGYTYNSFIAGGNGGGSGQLRFFVKWYNAGTQVPYTIGAGGVGSAYKSGTTVANGGNGGNTIFDGVTALGGYGGVGAGNGGGTSTGTGGQGDFIGGHGLYGYEAKQYIGGMGGDGYGIFSNDGSFWQAGNGGDGGFSGDSTAEMTNGETGTSGAVKIF